MAKQLLSFRFPSLLSVDGCEGIGTFEFVIESNLIFPWSAPCPLMATPEFTALEQRGRKFKIRFGPAAALDWPAAIIQMSPTATITKITLVKRGCLQSLAQLFLLLLDLILPQTLPVRPTWPCIGDVDEENLSTFYLSAFTVILFSSWVVPLDAFTTYK